MRFEEYVDQRGQALLRLAYLLTADHHLAEDLTQSALTSAYRHWRRVERAENRDAYVRRILVNHHASWSRRRSAHERPEPIPDEADIGPDIGAVIVEREAALRWLAELPTRGRQVLVLRYYEDLSDTAIAELLGLAPSTVRATAARAIGALRTSMESARERT